MFKKLLQKRRLQREENYVKSLPRYIHVKKTVSKKERIVSFDLAKYHITYDEKSNNLYLKSIKNNSIIVLNKGDLINE